MVTVYSVDSRDDCLSLNSEKYCVVVIRLPVSERELTGEYMWISMVRSVNLTIGRYSASEQ